ncbi:LOB domain-containing protein 12-like protein [Tanacetum coccineum]
MAPGHSTSASCKLHEKTMCQGLHFAPYFLSDNPHRFDVVHKVFNASNVGKMLQVLTRRELRRMMLTNRIQVAIFFKLLPCITSTHVFPGQEEATEMKYDAANRL